MLVVHDYLNAFIASYIINHVFPIVLQCAIQHFLNFCDEKLIDRTEIQKAVRRAPGTSCLFHSLFLISIKIVHCLWLWHLGVPHLLILRKFTGNTFSHWSSYHGFSLQPCAGDHLLQSWRVNMEGLEWGLKFQELIDSSVTNIGQTAV